VQDERASRVHVHFGNSDQRSGQIVGHDIDSGGVTYGYQVDWVSDRRRIVGYSTVPSGSFRGCLRAGTTSTTFDLSGAVQTSGAEIDAEGEIVERLEGKPPDGTPRLALDTAYSAA
jgi:hypothetical protein